MLSATDLGITEAEHAALQVVRDGLASGKFKHHLSICGAKGDCFNMQIPFDNGDCGIVACIGGWVAKIMGEDFPRTYVVFLENDSPLFPLYYPAGIDAWDLITPAIAARAITTFLDSGDVDYPALIGVAR